MDQAICYISDMATRQETIGQSKKYYIYAPFDYILYEGNWDGFVQWMRDNPTRIEYVFYQTDDADCCDECTDRGFTDAEEEFIEEQFGILV